MSVDQSYLEKEIHKPHLLSGWRFTALVATLIATAAGYFLFSLWGDWYKVVAAVADIGIGQILFYLLIALTSYLFRFLRWNYFLDRLGHKVPIMRSLRIYLSGFSLTTTPGKAGEALRTVFLVDHGIAYRRSFGALLAERLSDFIAVILLAAGGLTFLPATRPILLFSLLFIAALLYTLQQERWLLSIEKWANRKLEERVAHSIEFFIETILAFRSCFTTRALLYGILLGMVAWSLEGLILYSLLKVQGFELPLYTAISIHAFALLVGAITLLPAGLGAAEATMYKLLTYYAIPPAIAISTTLLLRLTTLWFSVLIGLLLLPKNEIKLR